MAKRVELVSFGLDPELTLAKEHLNRAGYNLREYRDMDEQLDYLLVIRTPSTLHQLQILVRKLGLYSQEQIFSFANLSMIDVNFTETCSTQALSAISLFLFDSVNISQEMRAAVQEMGGTLNELKSSVSSYPAGSIILVDKDSTDMKYWARKNLVVSVEWLNEMQRTAQFVNPTEYIQTHIYGGLPGTLSSLESKNVFLEKRCEDRAETTRQILELGGRVVMEESKANLFIGNVATKRQLDETKVSRHCLNDLHQSRKPHTCMFHHMLRAIFAKRTHCLDGWNFVVKLEEQTRDYVVRLIRCFGGKCASVTPDLDLSTYTLVTDGLYKPSQLPPLVAKCKQVVLLEFILELASNGLDKISIYNHVPQVILSLPETSDVYPVTMHQRGVDANAIFSVLSEKHGIQLKTKVVHPSPHFDRFETGRGFAWQTLNMGLTGYAKLRSGCSCTEWGAGVAESIGKQLQQFGMKVYVTIEFSVVILVACSALYPAPRVFFKARHQYFRGCEFAEFEIPSSGLYLLQNVVLPTQLVPTQVSIQCNERHCFCPQEEEYRKILGSVLKLEFVHDTDKQDMDSPVVIEKVGDKFLYNLRVTRKVELILKELSKPAIVQLLQQCDAEMQSSLIVYCDCCFERFAKCSGKKYGTVESVMCSLCGQYKMCWICTDTTNFELF